MAKAPRVYTLMTRSKSEIKGSTYHLNFDVPDIKMLGDELRVLSRSPRGNRTKLYRIASIPDDKYCVFIPKEKAKARFRKPRLAMALRGLDVHPGKKVSIQGNEIAIAGKHPDVLIVTSILAGDPTTDA